MSGSDPSQVDTPTLIQSCMRDFATAQEGLRTFHRFFTESQVTLHELLRRSQRVFEPLYKVRRAAPRPMRGRHFICDECPNVPDCPQLTDEVWYTIGQKDTLLCISCTEKRLGRRIEMTDLRDCMGNAFAFMLYDRLMSRL